MCVKGQLALLKRNKVADKVMDMSQVYLADRPSGSAKAKLPRGGWGFISWNVVIAEKLYVQFCLSNGGPFAKDLIGRGHQAVLLSPLVPRLYLEQSLLSCGINLVVNELITLRNGKFSTLESFSHDRRHHGFPKGRV